jgi:hypothetical protein
MKDTLSSPMNSGHPAPKMKTIEEADMHAGVKGRVNEIAADCVSGPMQGPRRDATGEREAELNKKQGW